MIYTHVARLRGVAGVKGPWINSGKVAAKSVHNVLNFPILP